MNFCPDCESYLILRIVPNDNPNKILNLECNNCGYKKNIDLEMLDPTGVVVEKWQLAQSMITKAAWDTASYSDDKLATIDLTIQMDRCILIY